MTAWQSLPGAEAGADADDERRVGDCGAEILLCEDRVDHHVRPQPRAAGSPGVGEHGDLSGGKDAADVIFRLRPLRRHVLDLIASI